MGWFERISNRSSLAHARETYERPLPRYVEQALRGYLRCGVFAHGSLRFHCDECGQDLLVAFSCKGRSLCPSCGAPLSPRRLTGYRTTSSRTVLLYRDTAFRQNGSRQRPAPGATERCRSSCLAVIASRGTLNRVTLT
ncbi:transposase zinc-binding domain-containing protein [Sorangium sp. So ce542]|uniref:transposase zinc-binding domain-containing protein n=1 Tax=Sorangium sp. So ce542 TaxID=3133316 RepID=UPI003F5EB64B